MAIDPKLKDAINHIQSHAQNLRAILTVADAVKAVEDIERMAGEEDVRLANTRALIVQKLAELEQVKADLRAALNDVEQANLKAKTTIADAREEAKKIKAKAVEDAKADVVKAIAAADVELKAKADKLGELDTAIGARQAEVEALDVSIADKTTEVKALEKRVALAKAYLDKAAALE